ncbi:MAG: LuxR C-terminal-related transcriptional regulator [Phycisphaerales bacterium]
MNGSHAMSGDEQEAPLATRCLETVCRAVQAPADCADHWLNEVARDVQRTAGRGEAGAQGGGAGATRLALMQSFPAAQTPWRLLSLGVCTSADAARAWREADEVGMALVLATRRDWPQWSSIEGESRGPVWTAERAELVPDDQWSDHPLRKARTLLGFDNMIVSVAPVGDPGDRVHLVLQFDQAFGEEWSCPCLLETARVLTPYLAKMLEHCVWRPLQRHRELLAQVSPIQREILPMLAEGRTEREIAGRMHRSPHTIHDHVKTIYAILGISSRVELLDAWHGLALAARANGAHAEPGSSPGEAGINGHGVRADGAVLAEPARPRDGMLESPAARQNGHGPGL